MSKALIPEEKVGFGEIAFIDWCRFTFDVKDDEDAINKATDFVCDVFSHADLTPAVVHGQMAYSGGVGYVFGVGAHAVRVASLFYGGERVNGTACIDINGRGCSLVVDWEVVRAWCDRLGAKLTRVDTAVDFLEGEFSIADAVKQYTRGGFGSGGRQPKWRDMGDWTFHKGGGRTALIGARANGKEGRIYEKGKQLGVPGSPWVRFEVEWLSSARRLPYGMLTEPARYFAGAYPICKRLLGCGAERIPRLRLEAEYSEEVMKQHLRRMYGPALYVLRDKYTTDTAMVTDLQRAGCPERLEKSAVRDRVLGRELTEIST